MKIIDNYKNSLIIDNEEYFIKLTKKIKLIINSKKDVKLIRAFYLFMVTMILFSVVYKFFKTA